MKRFNYLQTRVAPRWRLGTLAIDDRVRGPLAALLATVVVTCASCTVQLTRLHAAAQHSAASADALLLRDREVSELKVLSAHVAAERRLLDAIAVFRSATLERTNELAWIGNRLPSQMWLQSVRYEDGKYTLEGRSARIDTVAAAMLALRDDPGTVRAQLVSLHDDGSGGPERIRYSLRLEAPK